MTSKEITLPAATGMPDRVGQATVVEQSRAIAEVQGAILVAQRVPRNVATATSAMREACNQKFLADKAFFRFPRAGTNVTGASVYLARELARCWGNVQYGISEMHRDDARGESEMVAYAWDVQTNTRYETKFVVPHFRDTKDGAKKLTDMRDIYENNANSGARRVRECIFAILPQWFVEEAKTLCNKTIREGGGVPLQQRITNVIGKFATLGVTQSQLERKLGRGSNAWTDFDAAQLVVIGRSLETGETTVADEFEPDLVTSRDLGDAPEKPTPSSAPAPVDAEPATKAEPVSAPEQVPESTSDAEPEPVDDEADNAKVSKEQLKSLIELLAANGVDQRAAQVAVASFMLGERVPMLADLCVREGRYLATRIPKLVEAGTFADTVQRALAVKS